MLGQYANAIEVNEMHESQRSQAESLENPAGTPSRSKVTRAARNAGPEPTLCPMYSMYGNEIRQTHK